MVSQKIYSLEKYAFTWCAKNYDRKLLLSVKSFVLFYFMILHDARYILLNFPILEEMKLTYAFLSNVVKLVASTTYSLHVSGRELLMLHVTKQCC